MKKAIKDMSRAEAEKLVAKLSNPDALAGFLDHKNKHVKAKAQHKITRLTPVEASGVEEAS
jgi:hypothetical protein